MGRDRRICRRLAGFLGTHPARVRWRVRALRPRKLQRAGPTLSREIRASGESLMSDLGEFFRIDAAKFERTLPGSASRVWEHLTVPSKLKGWFGDDSTIEPREGGRVRLMGGHIRGVVTQWRPNRKLAYTWNVFGPGEEE